MEDDHCAMARPLLLAPLLVIFGAALLILTAGAEIVLATRVWLAGEGELPKDVILHTLVAGAALLLAAAVLMTRRSVQRTVAAEAALRESEERLRLVANNVPALISYVDRSQRYRFSNRTYDDWFGIAHEGMHVAAIQLQNDARRLEFLAHHDTLTGLPNRAMFADRAREAVAHARRHDKTAAFLFLDMDNFKQVNDRLGHEVGDNLLKVMASRLRASVRGDDFIARIGGDEFCVLMQEIADPREAAAVAQKLLHELGKSYRVGGHDVTSGASIGIACVPQDGHDVATLLRLADAAMYRAKEAGRNGYQFFSVVLNQDAAAAGAR